MKRGSSSQLKEAINALCRVLGASGGGPSPETFRQAKFNQAPATAEFWKLLWSLLKKVYVEESSAPVNEAENLDVQIRFVKSVLWFHGYGTSEFYRLPEDGSQGSRELLLAFSWLLHKVHLLEKLLEVSKLVLGDEITVCTCPGCPPPRPRTRNETPSKEAEVDVRYLQWLNGKLQFSWRALHAAQQEKCAAVHKIHSYTRGFHPSSSIGHFSITEVDIIREPEKYSELLQSIESENSRLEAYLDWKDLEPVYWQWMESVLKSKLEDRRGLQLQDIDNQSFALPVVDTYPGNPSSVKEIEELTEEFVALHNDLQEMVTCKRASWNEKIKEKEKELLNDAQFYLTATKIRQRVDNEAESLRQNYGEDKNKMHGSHRLVFKDTTYSVKRGSATLGHKDPSMKDLHATEVIRVLRVKGDALEKELRQLQEECRTKLEAIAEAFEGVVCIPPPKT
ncbi:tubulin epsilon and delta complex protein 1 [Lissotriton helveticus]